MKKKDMAREERQGQVTLPSQPAASQSAASQHSSEPSASYQGLLKKFKRQEKKNKDQAMQRQH